MLRTHSLRCLPLAALALATALPAAAQSGADGAKDTFFRAYYLENEAGDTAGALELYQEAARAARRSPELLAKIERRIQACSEELAAGDFASLVPEDTILYVELNDPGEQLSSLLRQLGLLQGEEGAGEIAVSPDLIDGTLGLRGAALAVTRVDPTGGIPGGVLILHPGDMKVIRGLIETALPAGGKPSGEIGGHPTYLVEDMVHVTMGERLVIASTERNLIEDVLRRVGGERGDSLAEHEDLQKAMSKRGDDLAYFCLNAEPVMPLVQNLLGSVAKQDPQAAMAIGLLDVQSLRTISGRVGVDDQGISLDFGLELAEGHQNVAFNFLRMPHVGPGTFQLVPKGAAAFFATSLNQRGGKSTGVTDANGRPVVTFMDIGREVFGNLVDVAIFTMPSISSGPHGQPLPDFALAMSVNDAERSRAIWELLLGIGQGATGSGNVQPHKEKVGGTRVARYDIEGVGVYLYSEGDRLVLSPSVRAIEAAVAAANGANISKDPVFAGLVHEASADHTSVIGVSLGRLAKIAEQVMPERELREVGPYLQLLAETTVVASTTHSDTELGLSARLSGLPNVGPVVERFVRAEMGHDMGAWERDERFADAAPAPEAVAASIEVTDEAFDPVAKFRELATNGEQDAAKTVLAHVADSFGQDANGMNTFVWTTVTMDGGDAYAKELLPIIERADEMTAHGNWYILDTLAHVQFAVGRWDTAVETSKRAVAVAREQNDPRAGEAEAALERFQAKIKASTEI